MKPAKSSRFEPLLFLVSTVALIAAADVACRAQPITNAIPLSRAAWMADVKWGVMTHYLADWRAQADKEPMSLEHWNQLVDHFDVEALADQIKSTGAGYHILTIGQNSGYY